MTTPPAPTPTEEEKKRAFEKVAQVKIYQLIQILDIINLASTRGAFRGNELSHVGAIHDTLNVGIEKAFAIVREEMGSEAVSIRTG